MYDIIPSDDLLYKVTLYNDLVIILIVFIILILISVSVYTYTNIYDNSRLKTKILILIQVVLIIAGICLADKTSTTPNEVWKCTYKIYYPNNVITKSVKSNINNFSVESYKGSNQLYLKGNRIESTTAPIEIINIIKIK